MTWEPVRCPKWEPAGFHRRRAVAFICPDIIRQWAAESPETFAQLIADLGRESLEQEHEP